MHCVTLGQLKFYEKSLLQERIMEAERLLQQEIKDYTSIPFDTWSKATHNLRHLVEDLEVNWQGREIAQKFADYCIERAKELALRHPENTLVQEEAIRAIRASDRIYEYACAFSVAATYGYSIYSKDKYWDDHKTEEQRLRNYLLELCK
jgi:hypothetical protein